MVCRWQRYPSQRSLYERGIQHPALFCDDLLASEASWVSSIGMPRLPLAWKAKVRYLDRSDQPCTILSEQNGILKVVFDIPQRARHTTTVSIVSLMREMSVLACHHPAAGPSA